MLLRVGRRRPRGLPLLRLLCTCDARRVEIDVGRDDGFCPVDEEERGEPGRPVWRGAETPEDGGQLVKPTAGRTDERLDESRLDAG